MSKLLSMWAGMTGTVLPYAGLTAPTDWLFCFGQAISRTTYVNLFNALTARATGNTTSGSPTISSVSSDLTSTAKAGMPISGPGIPAGTTVLSLTANSITMSANATATASGVALVIAPFGVGDGSTTFNLPDLRGRVSAGADDMGGAAANRLTNTGTGNPGVNGVQVGASGGADRHQLTVAQMPAHTHTHYSWNAAGPSTTSAGGNFGQEQTGSTGGNEAHTNVQPTIVLNHIIKI